MIKTFYSNILDQYITKYDKMHYHNVFGLYMGLKI